MNEEEIYKQTKIIISYRCDGMKEETDKVKNNPFKEEAGKMKSPRQLQAYLDAINNCW